MEKRNEIIELSLEFALDIIGFTELLEEKRKYVIARQLLKSGTSIGANVRESQSAESRADFIHKLKVAHKEAEETDYWITLCDRAVTYPSTSEKLKQTLLSIRKILSKIISSTRKGS